MKLREEEFYEQYHQHGGTTIIPTEIFNELYDDATEEIERLTISLQAQEELTMNEYHKRKRLESIIKEVREYIEDNTYESNGTEYMDLTGIKELLEILDKENNKTKEVMSVEELESYEPKNMAEQEYQDWFWD